MTKEEILEIEKNVDSFILSILDVKLPRNKFIYHLNLAYIDFIVDSNLLFSLPERDYIFSLTYITYLAHLKMEEEDSFDFIFDQSMYMYAFRMLHLGMCYSSLCNIFPLLHMNKAKLITKGDNVFQVELDELPRKNYKYINDYTIKKSLSYTLQFAIGMLEREDDESIALKLSKLYMNFWNENMLYDDFEPYTRMECGSISFFFITAAMRRFNKLYKNDFDIVRTDSQKMMIIFSPKGVNDIRSFIPTENEEYYNQALREYQYTPSGNGLYPKISVEDAPINVTKDGYMFANPLTILFSNSFETRYLSYIRKLDKSRYLCVKDKIKERVIPLLCEMLNYQHKDSYILSNFKVKIPGTKKQKRECDLLVVDKSGVGVYFEIKHFYYPTSVSEIKSLDKELNLAISKMPDQLEAITSDWENIKKALDINLDLENIYGVIGSHHYTGSDVEVHPEYPIVEFKTIYESIAQTKTSYHLYNKCKDDDLIYPSVAFIRKQLVIPYSKYRFITYQECLDPQWEKEFIKSYRKIVSKSINFNEQVQFKDNKSLAEAYIKKLS